MDYNHRTAAELWQRFAERHQAEMTPAILKAGEFALEAHRGQNRKIDCLPYVSHVFDVAEILLGCKASENLVITGILHDILEDTSQTADDIRALFPAEQGEAILHIIMADNESDKEAPWQERKMETIRYAETTEETDGLLLICADKISNLNSMVCGLESGGNLVWHYFHSPKDRQIWYYETLYNIFRQKLTTYDCLLKRYFNLLNLIR